MDSIIQVLQEEYERKATPENHHAHAVIIFCQYIGTIQLLESKLSELGDTLGFQLDVHTPTLNEEDEEDSYNSNAMRISSKLFEIGRLARTSNHLQVVISGKAVAEGHSLNWATHIVHWDMPANSLKFLHNEIGGSIEEFPTNGSAKITRMNSESPTLSTLRKTIEEI